MFNSVSARDICWFRSSRQYVKSVLKMIDGGQLLTYINETKNCLCYNKMSSQFLKHFLRKHLIEFG